MAASRTSELNFDLLAWDALKTDLRSNIRIQRPNANHDWQAFLDERVAKCHRELAPTTQAVNHYMQWIRARGKNVKAASKSISSTILGNRR